MVHVGGKTKNLNRDKIIGAAFVAFAVNPDATMAEIAEAAGVVRRTVYGHFPTRHDLIVGIVERAAQDFVDALPAAAALPREPDIALALLELSAWEVGDRYRALLGIGRRELGDQCILDILSESRKLTFDVIADGRVRGVFTRNLPTETVIVASEAASLALLDYANRREGGISATVAADVALSLAGVDSSRRKDAIREAEIVLGAIEARGV